MKGKCNKKRILFPFVGDTIGGSHLSALTLIDELKESGYEVVILVYRRGPLTKHLDEKLYEYDLMSDMFFCPRGSFVKNSHNILKANFSSLSYLFRNRFDVVHTNDLRMHLSWFASFLMFSQHIWHQRSVSGRAMFFSLFSSVVTITDFCRESFPKIVKGKTKVIKDPVTLNEKFQHSKKSDNHDILSIVWIANLVETKRIQDALMIVDALKKKRNVELNVLGSYREPSYSNACEMIKSLDIDSCVNLRGFTKDAYSWIEKSDVLLATAEDEGMGRTLIEAMLIGTPVVASAHGGHLEVVDDGVTGLLVELGNIDGFCDAILRIKDNPSLRNSLISNSKLMAEKRYSSKSHKDEITKIYGF